MNKNKLIRIAEKLHQEAFDANAYFLIMQQYGINWKEYREEMKLSSAFYCVVYQALQKACFIEVAKLYDRTNGAYSIGTMLNKCKENISLFPQYREEVELKDDGKKNFFSIPYRYRIKPMEERFFKEQVQIQRVFYKFFNAPDADTIPVTVDLAFSELLELYQKRYNALSKKRNNISEQRNKIYAHNDERSISNMSEILEKNKLFYKDINELIEFALDVTGLIIGVLTGECKAEKYSNIDDWVGTLMLARLGLKYQQYDFEQEEKALYNEMISWEKGKTR